MDGLKKLAGCVSSKSTDGGKAKKYKTKKISPEDMNSDIESVIDFWDRGLRKKGSEAFKQMGLFAYSLSFGEDAIKHLKNKHGRDDDNAEIAVVKAINALYNQDCGQAATFVTNNNPKQLKKRGTPPKEMDLQMAISYYYTQINKSLNILRTREQKDSQQNVALSFRNFNEAVLQPILKRLQAGQTPDKIAKELSEEAKSVSIETRLAEEKHRDAPSIARSDASKILSSGNITKGILRVVGGVLGIVAFEAVNLPGARAACAFGKCPTAAGSTDITSSTTSTTTTPTTTTSTTGQITESDATTIMDLYSTTSAKLQTTLGVDETTANQLITGVLSSGSTTNKIITELSSTTKKISTETISTAITNYITSTQSIGSTTVPSISTYANNNITTTGYNVTNGTATTPLAIQQQGGGVDVGGVAGGVVGALAGAAAIAGAAYYAWGKVRGRKKRLTDQVPENSNPDPKPIRTGPVPKPDPIILGSDVKKPDDGIMTLEDLDDSIESEEEIDALILGEEKKTVIDGAPRVIDDIAPFYVGEDLKKELNASELKLIFHNAYTSLIKYATTGKDANQTDEKSSLVALHKVSNSAMSYCYGNWANQYIAKSGAISYSGGPRNSKPACVEAIINELIVPQFIMYVKDKCDESGGHGRMIQTVNKRGEIELVSTQAGTTGDALPVIKDMIKHIFKKYKDDGYYPSIDAEESGLPEKKPLPSVAQAWSYVEEMKNIAKSSNKKERQELISSLDDRVKRDRDKAFEPTVAELRNAAQQRAEQEKKAVQDQRVQQGIANRKNRESYRNKMLSSVRDAEKGLAKPDGQSFMQRTIGKLSSWGRSPEHATDPQEAHRQMAGFATRSGAGGTNVQKLQDSLTLEDDKGGVSHI